MHTGRGSGPLLRDHMVWPPFGSSANRPRGIGEARHLPIDIRRRPEPTWSVLASLRKKK
jgi:hypothetical protein